MLAKCLIYDFTFTFSFFFFICSKLNCPGRPFFIYLEYLHAKKMVDKVEISIWYIWMWRKWKAKLWNPWWLLLHSASALINGLNWERQMKFQMKVIVSIKFKPSIQMAETQKPTLLRLSVWMPKKSLPTSIIHNPIPRSKCHCLFDVYCAFAKSPSVSPLKYHQQALVMTYHWHFNSKESPTVNPLKRNVYSDKCMHAVRSGGPFI